MQDLQGKKKALAKKPNGADKESEVPFFTPEQLKELYTDEPGESDADKLKFNPDKFEPGKIISPRWLKEFKNKKRTDIKESLPEGDFSDQERKKILEQVKKVVKDMKQCLRLSLVERAGLNNFKNNQDYFFDFSKVLKRAKIGDSLGKELSSGLGSYRILGTIEKRIQEDDYKKMMKYFQDLENKGSIAAIRITETPRYLFLKKALIQAEENKKTEQ